VIDAPPFLSDAARLSADKLLNPEGMHAAFAAAADRPVLVVLAAGKGTRFGTEPKCIQSVGGKPLARHSIDAFQRRYGGPVVCLVHYRQDDVMAALGDDLVYVHSDDPTGGTAFAAYEAFSVPYLRERDGLLFVTMGDRVVPESVFARMEARHAEEAGPGPRLTLLAARYEPPRHVGKGRIVRDARGRITRIVEQRDIDAASPGDPQATWQDVTEANCPLYVLPADLLHAHLADLTNDNAQGQYYLTDVVERIAAQGGDVRALTVDAADAEYDWLIADVTRPHDLALLEGLFQRRTEPAATGDDLERAAATLRANRPPGQAAAIAAQLRELLETAKRERQGFDPDLPVAVGVSGGRLRIAFMHPDMGRFFGPAWQMPIGAADAAGREQIVVLAQGASDGAIHLFPTDHEFQERLSALPADDDAMYPGDEVTDWYAYEGFGTRMAERMLLSLGYFTQGEVERRRYAGLPLPPPELWVANGMRRPFSLIGNAIASVRTVREGALGARVQRALGREGFGGLRLATTGRIPRGGFSSSSAVTVAVKNAVNALYDLGIPPDLLVHLACQAEYGTGVRAGSLDQATEQKGVAGQGALISSNPRDNFRVLGVYPVPTDRFRVFFPYTVDRDRDAWQWSYGMYGESVNDPLPTTGEIRKLTGKAAEMAAILVDLPLDEDFFPHLEADLLQTGALAPGTAAWVAATLRRLPLRVSRGSLGRRLSERRAALIDEWRAKRDATPDEAARQVDATLGALLEGWREPLLRRASRIGGFELESGVPLRAIVAYLFGEVVKNARLLHAPDTWIETVTRSQGGDRCFDIDPAALPDADAMMDELPWELGRSGPERMAQWLTRAGATPVDVDRGLDDDALADPAGLDLYRLRGGNFFRGLALIDLAEAMLKRAFGMGATAVRVNAAGQGDYFQVHVDSGRVTVPEVQEFLRRAFYRRFGLAPEPEFIVPSTGGGAVGLRLERFDRLPELIRLLEQAPARGSVSTSRS
jgi:NDP-sugar pyrophosphorylase family protein